MKADKDNLIICYIGGGSKNWAWTLMRDLSMEREIGGTVRLYDINPQAAKDNETIGNALMKAEKGRWRFEAEPDLGKALAAADFVFISVLPGDFDRMRVDVHTPEKYGIWQSVGDTVGPGGYMRALRTLPMFQVIARAVRDHSPDAWVFNYTNPMTMCTRMLYREFPEIKAFGCCHEVFGTQKLLVKVIERAGLAPTGSIHRSDIKTNVLGINHFTWMDKASWKGMDLLPLYKRFADEHAETGAEGMGDDNWLNTSFSSLERVKLDLFRRYGLIAAAGDRHLAEFCPPSWYLANPETVTEWKFGLTTVDYRISMREDLKKKAARYVSGQELLKPAESGEEGIAQMKALLGLGDIVTNVNLPNRGQMTDLAPGAVVETNAVFSRDSIVPVVAGSLPHEIRALTQVHVANQEGLVDAAAHRDLDKAFRVFTGDFQVQKINPKDARKLFAEMTAGTLFPEDGYGRFE